MKIENKFPLLLREPIKREIYIYIYSPRENNSRPITSFVLVRKEAHENLKLYIPLSTSLSALHPNISNSKDLSLSLSQTHRKTHCDTHNNGNNNRALNHTYKNSINEFVFPFKKTPK
jgi:hypothetical protein